MKQLFIQSFNSMEDLNSQEQLLIVLNSMMIRIYTLVFMHKEDLLMLTPSTQLLVLDSQLVVVLMRKRRKVLMVLSKLTLKCQ
jgi:hypothetical protein